MSHLGLVILFTVLLLPGFLGIFLPLPSLLYMLAVALIFGFIDHWQHLSGWNLIILAGIAAASLLVEYLTGIIGAKYGGASKTAIIFGIVGTVVGLVIFPPFGGILGLFIGIIAAEIVLYKDSQKAFKAATGGLIGTLVGMLASLILGLIFVTLFLIFALK